MTDERRDVTHIDVRYVADLARIALTDAEAARYGAELDAILAYVDQLGELNTDGIVPMAHAMPLTNVMRDDEPGETVARETVIRNAPASSEDAYIRVPVVIEEEGA